MSEILAEILIPALIVCGIGLIAAVLLTLAYRFMGTKTDEKGKEKELLNALPGINCGACGFAGCEAYATSLAKGETDKPNLCVPGADKVGKKISEIMGVRFEDVVEKTAFVRCGGDCSHNKKKAHYQGISSCSAACGVFGGEDACSVGCLGYGDCAAVCPVRAICIKDGLARINHKKCIGCGKCADVCPNKIIAMFDGTEKTAVCCSNTEKGVITRKKCDAGCIGCGKCEKICPAEAVTVKNNLAKINYNKCIRCGKCADICPCGCIVNAAAPFKRNEE